MHPGPAVLKLEGDDNGGSSQAPCGGDKRHDLFENPHCVVREHLEFLVESQKSLLPICTVIFFACLPRLLHTFVELICGFCALFSLGAFINVGFCNVNGGSTQAHHNEQLHEGLYT